MATGKADPQQRAAKTYSPQAIHLVRTAVQANLTLSQMADQKASILLGATFVVFTLTVGQVSRGRASASLLMLGLFALLSAFCAVLVVMPAIKAPERPSGENNILFFSVFSQLGEGAFIDRVLGELVTDETIFRIMLRDIHQNGLVLQRKKYRFLGYAYRLFLTGLILTSIVTLIEHWPISFGRAV